MRHPLRTTEISTPRSRWAQAASGALAVGIEVAVLAALVAGLSLKVLPPAATRLISIDILHPQEQKAQPVPVPNPTLVKPEPAYVPPPDIRIAAPARTHAITATTVQHPPIPTAPVAAPAPVAPAPPAPTPARGILATHTIPPYPEVARRLGQQGASLISITVETDGSIGAVSLVQSSGSQFLDQAALDWVKSHWRYRAATQNGRPVQSQVQASVVFNLKNAR